MSEDTGGARLQEIGSRLMESDVGRNTLIMAYLSEGTRKRVETSLRFACVV